MSTDIRFKRGTTTAVQAYTALLGEPVFDLEKKRLYIGTDSTLEYIGGDSFNVEDDTLDDINDGTTYGKVKNLDLTSGRVDFDKVNDGSTYGKVRLADLTLGRIDLDKINNGTTYGKVKNLDLTSGRVDFDKLYGLDTTADELNELHNAGCVQADFIKLASVSASAAEINYLDNPSLTAADLTKLADLTASASDINQLDGITVGGDSTGDILTTIDVQTVRHKRFSDISTFFQDSTDHTKKFRFEVSYISSSTTRTLIVPDSDGTIMLVGDAPTSHVHAGEDITTGTVAAARIADLSSTYAVVALGVTNGNSHDHSGGDGAQIDHTTLSNIGSNSHATIDSHISNTTSFHGITSTNVSNWNTAYGWGDHAGLYALTGTGVTNGNSHDHNGGDGAQISHLNLSSIGTNSHATIDSFISGHSYSFGSITSGNAAAAVECGFTGNDSTPAIAKFGAMAGYYTKIMSNTAGSEVWIAPSNNNVTDLNLSFIGGVTSLFKNIELDAATNIELTAGGIILLDATGNTQIDSDATIDMNAASLDVDVSGAAYITSPSLIQLDSYVSSADRSMFELIGAAGDSYARLTVEDTNVEQKFIFLITALYPDVPDYTNCGSTDHEWENVYTHNSPVVGDFYFMDSREENGKIVQMSDLETIMSIKPSKNIDKRNGFVIIDDNTIPEWLKFKNRKTGKTEYNKLGKPYLDLKTMISLLMGGERELNSIYKDIDKRLEIIEKFIQNMMNK